MERIEEAFKRGLITRCRYEFLKLAYRVQNSGLKEKEGMIFFAVSRDTYYRLKRAKIEF